VEVIEHEDQQIKISDEKHNMAYGRKIICDYILSK
jgi:hypothetical protein